MDVPSPLAQRVLDIPSPDDKILLDIGGVFYSTTLKTLRAVEGSYFDTMFSGVYAIETDDNGRYFIDRNGKLFMYILDYMRNGKVTLPADQCLAQRIKLEAEFYGMDLIPLEEKKLMIPDSTPNVNYCNAVATGGLARLVAVDGVNGATPYSSKPMHDYLTPECLLDYGKDNLTQSIRTTNDLGSSWNNPTPNFSIGRMIIDMGRAAELSTLMFFRGYAGNITGVNVYAHPELGRYPEIGMDDPDWYEIVPWTHFDIALDHSSPNSTPAASINLPNWVSTRYLKVEFKSAAFAMEVRQIKAYSSLSGDVTRLNYVPLRNACQFQVDPGYQDDGFLAIDEPVDHGYDDM